MPGIFDYFDRVVRPADRAGKRYRGDLIIGRKMISDRLFAMRGQAKKVVDSRQEPLKRFKQRLLARNRKFLSWYSKTIL